MHVKDPANGGRRSAVRFCDCCSRLAASQATAKLHAEKGPVATSYADIAHRAGVSLPTVHRNFPTQAAMMSACTGHVAAGAPPLPVEEILAASDLQAAAATLVISMDALHAYFEPWVSWRSEKTIPFVAEMRINNRDRLTKMLVQLLSRHRKGPQAACAAAWESILSFDLWERLVRQHLLPRAGVRALLVDLLLAALGPEPAAPRKPVSRRPP